MVVLIELGANKAKKGKAWKGYEVFIPVYSGDPIIGLPLIILQKDEDAEKFLCETVAAINRRIFAINLKEFSPHPMSTTLVALLFTPGRAIMLNVGDSRFYMASGGDHVAQISTDHTLANEKHLAPETLEDDPRALHALTRSIGTRYNLKFEIRTLALQGDERFLLCSDGVP